MNQIPGIRVRQWLDRWNDVQFDPDRFQSEPVHEFYLASIPARMLRAFGTTHQRDVSDLQRREDDTSIQRSLEQDRSDEIQRYIRDGYPLSSIATRALQEDQEASLRKPGWLPTAIIANIIPAGGNRGGKTVAEADALTVNVGEGTSAHVTISTPSSWTTEHDSKKKVWKPSGARPIEIIDGQHRLSAFNSDTEDFELPVVIFTGLDFSWQAYLFWTVNIKPKRINTSLAYDLYPLLRHQDWLEQGESLGIYRETRAQELVESLWGETQSVWRDRINMLGQTGMRAQRPVTQAAFIRSLTSTFVRTFKGYQGFGGLFGSAVDDPGLEWPRGQQSAFLVRAWRELAEAIAANRNSEWVIALREEDSGQESLFADILPGDPAFDGDRTLLASDVGVRGFHMVLNDLAYLGAPQLHLREWQVEKELETSYEKQYKEAWAGLNQNPVGEYLRRLAMVLSTFDWRNSKAPGLTRDQVELRRALRGSGGYPVLRDRLFDHIARSGDELLAPLAARALELRRPTHEATS